HACGHPGAACAATACDHSRGRWRRCGQAAPHRLVGQAAARRRQGLSLMQSRWVDRDAKAAIDRYARAGVPAVLALRVYSTRLLGGDPKLVLHGGGNTSVKTRMRDLAGD